MISKKTVWRVTLPKATGLVSPRLRLEPQVRRGCTLPFAGFPASQGQQLNFGRVEEVEGAPHSPVGSEQGARKNQ